MTDPLQALRVEVHAAVTDADRLGAPTSLKDLLVLAAAALAHASNTDIVSATRQAVTVLNVWADWKARSAR